MDNIINAFRNIIFGWLCKLDSQITLKQYLKNYFGFEVINDEKVFIAYYENLDKEIKNKIINFFKENPDKLLKVL